MKRYAVTFFVDAETAGNVCDRIDRVLPELVSRAAVDGPYRVTELDGDGSDEPLWGCPYCSNECEHACGRAVAPGVRFCSTACADCEGGGAPCSQECKDVDADVAKYKPTVADTAAPDERVAVTFIVEGDSAAAAAEPARRKDHLRRG